MVARAAYAAARLEQAWERWRALHGLSGSADPLASYVGYSHQEPMGQPRVVIGVDAAEAEYFADFLEGHDCAAPGLSGDASAASAAGLPVDTRSVSGSGHLPVNGAARPPDNGALRPSDSGALYPPVSGPQPVMANGSPHPGQASAASRGPGPAGPIGMPSRDGMTAGPGGGAGVANGGGAGSAPAPRDVPSEPMVRLVDDTDPHARPAAAAERPITGPQAPVPPVPPAFPAPVPTFTPIGETGPAGLAGEPGPGEPWGAVDPLAGSEPPDVIAAELAGWASGELPGQASEQLASWASADAPGGRALKRPRFAR
jgi:hypothetical protein